MVARARRDGVRDQRRVRRRLSRQLRVARRRAAVRRRTTSPRSATATGGPRRGSSTQLDDRRGGRASRRRAARSPSWARARSTTSECAIVFDPEVARAICRHARSASRTAAAFWRKSSYLVGKRRARQVASPLVTIVDDPLIRARARLAAVRRRGPADAQERGGRQGRAAHRACATCTRARKLGRAVDRLAPAAASAAARTSTTSNLDPAGRARRPRAELLEQIDRGPLRHRAHGLRLQPGHRRLLARRAAASGSRTASSRFPVSEITISANFDELWKRIDAVGNDLDAAQRRPPARRSASPHDDRRQVKRLPWIVGIALAAGAIAGPSGGRPRWWWRARPAVRQSRRSTPPAPSRPIRG